MRTRTLTYLVALLLSMVALSCDETLPPREEMPVVLTGSLTMLRTQGLVVVRDGTPVGTGGAFSFTAVNVYDEVLDDSAAIGIELDVWLQSDSTLRTKVRITPEAITSSGFLHGKYLTLRPNTPMTFIQPWLHRTSDGTPFWDHVRLFPGATTSGEPYCQSADLVMVAKGTARLFPKLAPIYIPRQEFTFAYRVFGITCPPAP